MTQPIAVKTKFMQEVNAAATLTQLRSAGRISVSSLSKQTGLSRQAVSRSLAALEADGFIEISEPDRTAAKSGRPPQMVRFRTELASVVAIDVNPRSVRVIVADLAGDTVGETFVEVGTAGVQPIGDILVNAVTAALADAGVSPDTVWHASIGAPGIVDRDAATVTLIPNMPGAAGSVLVDALRSVLTCPISLDNDVKLATQGERWRGQPRGDDALIFIDWSERIGAGIVLHGELYRGASNDSGDLGYLDLLVDTGDVPDADGPSGSFERWIGTRELRRIAAQRKAARDGSEPTLAELAEAAHHGELWAVESVRVVASRFAKGVAVLRAVVDPDVVVVGGEVTVFGSVLLEAVRDALESEPLNQPRLEMSGLGRDAIVQGAIHQSLSAIEREHFNFAAMRQTSP